MKKEKQMGDLLLKSGVIDENQLSKAFSVQAKTAKKLEDVLLEEAFVDEEDLINILSLQLGIPRVNFMNITIDSEAVSSIPYILAKKHIVLPLKYDEKSNLIVAMNQPLDLIAIEDLKLVTQKRIIPYMATKSEIISYIEKFYNSSDAQKAIEEFNKSQSVEDRVQEEIEDESYINNAPIVRIVNNIIEKGVRSKASDIHIEPFEHSVYVRMRVDGVLQKLIDDLNINTHNAVVSRIKILSDLNIAERRLPQDGALIMHIDNRDIDFRISILPTIYGEKVVIRILDKGQFNLDFNALHFTNHERSMVNDFMKAPHGIVLVTGPTGSGKSTTLYTILRELNSHEENIITVEDPVELKINGINQVQVNMKTGLTFVEGLRSILRQDPDIIMIGEIRDSETAKIAIRASITGHLVLSTIHTNDAVSTITRLIDMGVEPYLVSSSILGIISQRLVRVLCSRCKTICKATSEEQQLLNMPEEELLLHYPVGCNICNNTGYRGRRGVHEVVKIDKKMREAISKGFSYDQLTDLAKKSGMVPLIQNAKELVLKGITTIDEVLNISFFD
ncbi:GspE/PulE family protein [Alkalibaculum bacchi]|mgnify:CR=1 FL=1|uniref:GspE/PulE family protein n=1 Tax=Alkalibaculum bacchi TaxID=645887 RepID=UPI0026EFDC4E|nr:type II/IV secretion system protein [Alkalibaculum bacchi]